MDKFDEFISKDCERIRSEWDKLFSKFWMGGGCGTSDDVVAHHNERLKFVQESINSIIRLLEERDSLSKEDIAEISARILQGVTWASYVFNVADTVSWTREQQREITKEWFEKQAKATQTKPARDSLPPIASRDAGIVELAKAEPEAVRRRCKPLTMAQLLLKKGHKFLDQTGKKPIGEQGLRAVLKSHIAEWKPDTTAPTPWPMLRDTEIIRLATTKVGKNRLPRDPSVTAMAILREVNDWIELSGRGSEVNEEIVERVLRSNWERWNPV